jgi:hypothetical protein
MAMNDPLDDRQARTGPSEIAVRMQRSKTRNSLWACAMSKPTPLSRIAYRRPFDTRAPSTSTIGWGVLAEYLTASLIGLVGMRASAGHCLMPSLSQG